MFCYWLFSTPFLASLPFSHKAGANRGGWISEEVEDSEDVKECQ
jgi:hypothetical protein